MADILTRSQVRQIRAWVGTEPDDADLQERYDDAGGGEALGIARSILQERLGSLTTGPASWGAEGDYTESNVETMKILQGQIADLSMILDGSRIPGFDPSAVEVNSAALFRTDRERLT